MKKYLIALLAICGMSSIASAQLVDSRTFSLSGANGVEAFGKIDFFKTSAKSGTVKLHVDLSDSDCGILTGVGLNVSSKLNYSLFSFNETSTDWPTSFVYTGADNVGGEQFQSTAWSTLGLLTGVSSGNTVDFSFSYKASNSTDFTNGFNSAGFFGDTDTKDLFLSFDGIGNHFCGCGATEILYWAWTSNPTPEQDVPTSAVPEPSTYGMIGAAALCGLVLVRRKIRK